MNGLFPLSQTSMLILNQTEPALHKKEKGKAKQWVGLVKKAEKDMPKFGNTCMDIM